MYYDLDNILEQAFEFYERGDYKNSLLTYEWFFDNAEIYDPEQKSAKYRSLKEWYSLGQKYKPALDSLVSKKVLSYIAFQKNSTVELFREYAYICHALKNDDEVIDVFKDCTKKDPIFAKQAYQYIEHILIENKKWKICETFIQDSMKTYQEKLAILDELLNISKHAYNGMFDQKYIKKYLEDIDNLFQILKSSHRYSEIEEIKKRVLIDMTTRSITSLAPKANIF